jgi:ElaB/YqjD/DUF883 family membrane-anchored ribosome-binding protein
MVTDQAFGQRLDEDIEERSNRFVPKALTRIKEADEQVISLLRERPIATLCAAMAVGYVIGRIFSRA